MNSYPEYINGDRVIIHSLGPEGQEFKGTIRGISIRNIPPATIWIVQLDHPFQLQCSYDCATIPGSCPRPE